MEIKLTRLFSTVLLAPMLSNNALASIVTYEFSFTAQDMMNYSFVNGADGSTAAENGLFDGARLSREGGPSEFKRTYVESEHSDFTDWATTTTDRLTTLNFWGFDGRGAGWGEDFKHTDKELVSGVSGWNDWDPVGWDAGWGANPNPNTAVTAGWFANTAAEGFGFGDANLVDKVFTFQLDFDDSDWLYGEETNGAPNTLGGPMTFWFGGWMGDDTSNMYKYIYEGNLVLTGTKVVSEPGAVLLLGLGFLGLIFRKRSLID
ncbi:MAG: PEP-CTERM sorting domain-containing protein [Marinomonas sp.]